MAVELEYMTTAWKPWTTNVGQGTREATRPLRPDGLGWRLVSTVIRVDGRTGTWVFGYWERPVEEAYR